MDEEYGRLEIRLMKLIEARGLNRNKLAIKAAMNWKQVDNYCNSDITRLDTLVLCKLCTALECEVKDLLVFIPAEKKP